MPDGSSRSRQKSTFNTLAREESFRNPTDKGSTIPILNEFVAPHIESFNALFDDSGLPSGDGDGRGLLSLGIKEIGERVVFDGNGKVSSESGETGWGNRMSSEFKASLQKLCRNISVQYGSTMCRYLSRWYLSEKSRLRTDGLTQQR
jgi:hypothetical protein